VWSNILETYNLHQTTGLKSIGEIKQIFDSLNTSAKKEKRYDKVLFNLVCNFKNKIIIFLFNKCSLIDTKLDVESTQKLCQVSVNRFWEL